MADQRIDVAVINGMVCLDTEAGRYTFSGYTAINMAQSLMDCAKDVGVRAQVQIDRMPVSAEKRQQVIVRIANMLRSMQHLDPNVVAAHVVDRVMVETEPVSVFEDVSVKP